MADNNKLITKGCKVEVCSNEPGFDGAWYVATVVDIVDQTPIKNNNKKTPNKRFTKNKTGYLVRYDTLYEEEDLNENLCETVDPRFVRPIPPKAVVDGEEFKVDDVIDAYHRDGWWIGIVKKVTTNVEESGRKYLVSFENPPEDVEFEKDLLRFHVDWVDSCWKLPPTINNKQTQEHESADINVTHTAESNNDAQSGFTTPSRAARPTDLENPSTCRLRSSKKRSRLQQNTESNSEMIGAVEGAVTHNFRKTRSRTVNSVEENSRGDRSQASAGGKRKKTVQVHVMEGSGSLAMHQDSPIVEQEAITAETSEAEEGQSQQRTKKGRPLLLEETSKTGEGQMVKSPSGLQEGGKRKKAVQVHVMEGIGSQAMHQDSPIVEQEAITAETSETEEGQSQKRTKKGRPLLLEETSKAGDGQMVKSPNGLQEVGKRKKTVQVHVMEGRGSQAMHQDSPIVEQEAITAETSEAEEGQSQQRTKKGRPPLLLEETSKTGDGQMVKSPNGLQEGGKRKKAVQVHVMEGIGSQAMHQDSPIVEQEAITAETSETEEGQSQQRTKKGRPLLLEETSKAGDGQMVKSPNGLQEVGKRKKTVQVHVMEGSGSQAMHQDSPMVEQEAITAETSEAEEGQSQQRTKKGRPPLLLEETSKTGDGQMVKSPNGLQEGGKRKKTVQVHMMEGSASQAMHQDSPIVEQEATTAETSEAEEGQSQQRTTKGRPLLLEETSKTGDGQIVKSPNGLQEGNQNARNRDSSATSELDDLPLSVWWQGRRPHSVLNRSSCRNRNLPDNHDRTSGAPMPLSQAIVNNGGTNNEQQVWPFVKQSFYWATIESMELHQKQKPHFSPLKKMKEGCREGHAIGHMVTFENVIRDVLNYQPSNPIEKINNSLELLDELEPHGFDVSAVRGRLNTFLSSKVKVGELKAELKKFENDIEICSVEKRAVEEELNELEVKIQELQEVMVRNVKMKAVKDQDIKRLQSNVDLVANQITEAELAIKELAARPL